MLVYLVLEDGEATFRYVDGDASDNVTLLPEVEKGTYRFYGDTLVLQREGETEGVSFTLLDRPEDGFAPPGARYLLQGPGLAFGFAPCPLPLEGR